MSTPVVLMRTWTQRTRFDVKQFSDWHLVRADTVEDEEGWATVCGGRIPKIRRQRPGEANVSGRVCIACLHALIEHEQKERIREAEIGRASCRERVKLA